MSLSLLLVRRQRGAPHSPMVQAETMLVKARFPRAPRRLCTAKFGLFRVMYSDNTAPESGGWPRWLSGDDESDELRDRRNGAARRSTTSSSTRRRSRAAAGAATSSSPSSPSRSLVAARRHVHGRRRREGRGAEGRRRASSCRRSPSIVPGRQDVAALISATGSLAARRDMPVGVPGEGGQVVRVLVEPGQWVGAGQTLAVIDRSRPGPGSRAARRPDRGRAAPTCGSPRTSSTAPRRWSSRGFVSQADLDRKRAARDAAAARVRVAAGAARRDPRPDRPARRPRARPRASSCRAASRPARSSAPARAPCSGSPPAARWSCAPACRRPISRGFASACRRW